MPSHHPDDSLLIEYAAGSLAEAKALLVATHLALCPACRAAVRDAEIVGGFLLRDNSYCVGTGEPREPGRAADRAPITVVDAVSSSVPNPLRGYLGRPVRDLPWRPVWHGMSEFALPQFSSKRVRLLQIRPGGKMPRHTHGGDELTLVLQGSFVDGQNTFHRGDVASADQSIDHQPKAGRNEICLCLAVEEEPLKLTGLLGAAVGVGAKLRRLISAKTPPALTR